MANRDNKNITLGSGKIYAAVFDSKKFTVDDVCKTENLLGYIKGGAALQYTAEYFEEKDDLGIVSKVIPTSETASLKCGLITWNGETLQKLVDRCKVTTADGKRTVKIGGHGNAQSQTYAICFHHEDETSGDLWVLIKGHNTAGFTITYSMDAGSLIEPEFKALPHDTEGTLIQLIEEAATTTTG